MFQYCTVIFALLIAATAIAGSREDFEQRELRDDIISALEQHQIIYQDLYARYSEQKEVVKECIAQFGWDDTSCEEFTLLIGLMIEEKSLTNLLELKIGDTALDSFDLLQDNPQSSVMALPSSNLQGIHRTLAARPMQLEQMAKRVVHDRKRTRAEADLPYDYQSEDSSNDSSSTEECSSDEM